MTLSGPAIPEGAFGSCAHAHFKVLIFLVEKVVNQIAAITAQAVPDGTLNPAIVYQDTKRASVFQTGALCFIFQQRRLWNLLNRGLLDHTQTDLTDQ